MSGAVVDDVVVAPIEGDDAVTADRVGDELLAMCGCEGIDLAATSGVCNECVDGDARDACDMLDPAGDIDARDSMSGWDEITPDEDVEAGVKVPGADNIDVDPVGADAVDAGALAVGADAVDVGTREIRSGVADSPEDDESVALRCISDVAAPRPACVTVPGDAAVLERITLAEASDDDEIVAALPRCAVAVAIVEAPATLAAEGVAAKCDSCGTAACVHTSDVD